jgi:histidyl-tRNA synthetase
MDRILTATKAESGTKLSIEDKNTLKIVVACLDKNVEPYALKVIQHLHKKNIEAVCRFDDNKLVKTFNYATKINSRFVVILGLEEQKNHNVIIKDQLTMKQLVTPFDEMCETISSSKQ